MLKDITSQGGTCRFDLSSSRTRMEVRGVDCLEKANATSANVTHSGLRFYDFEVRGGLSNSFLIDYLQGASSTDLIMFDRFYLHRTHSGVMGTDCGQLAVYDCPTESYVGDREFDGAHGSDIGNPTVNQYVNNVITQNSIVEITGDGFGIFGPGKNVIYRNCTLGYSNSYNANTRQESIRFGVSGQPSGIASYNNVFYVDSVTGSNYNGSYWSYGTTWANYAGDNNLYLHPFNSSANMATTSITFNGMGSLADVSLPTMISTYGQEANSIVVCYSGCSDSVVHYYNDGDNSRNYFTKPHTSDGTVSDYTPTAVNRGRDSGRNDQCPSEDFYGRPRNDGRCDIGAVEYQGNPPDTTPPNPVTNFTATPGTLQITLAWTHSSSSDSKGTLVRAKTTGYPTGPADGSLVCDKLGLPGVADSCLHGSLTAGTTYYYAAYSYDAASNYGTGVQASAAPNPSNGAPTNVQNLRRTDTR